MSQLTRPMMLATLAGLAAVTIAAAPARADSVPYGYYQEPLPSPRPRDPWKKPRFEGGIGALIGGQRVGYVYGTAGGMHFDAGLRMDRLFLYAEYDFLSIGQNSLEVMQPVRGFLHRVGGSARYSMGAFGGKGDVPVRGDLWAEIGLGHQHVSWHEGGVLGRKDVSFGFGAQATFRIGRDKPRYLGVYYAMKAFVAASPTGPKDDVPTCAGPCDTPTGPSPYDIGVYFNFGIPFGR